MLRRILVGPCGTWLDDAPGPVHVLFKERGHPKECRSAVAHRGYADATKDLKQSAIEALNEMARLV